jgi:hypothetical protein
VTLHITNGDCTADILRRIVDGPVAIAADVLHEGPCPGDDGDAWYAARARFLAPYAGMSADELKADLAAADQVIVDACGRASASAGRNDIELWFEHDLFDQLAVIRTLDLVARVLSASKADARVSLICIDRFPGVDPFYGLGQLTGDQLATLIGTSASVTPGHYRLAVDAWKAFRSPDPRDLVQVAYELSAAKLPVSEGGPALPFLGDALLRFLAEYPSAANGLSRTEQFALQALASSEQTGGALFGATQAREAAPFMGDLQFFDILRRLASCREPLLTIDAVSDADDLRLGRVALTGAGRDVIAGRSDHIRLNGIDVWRGGVHLAGSNASPWRWDAVAETLVS